MNYEWLLQRCDSVASMLPSAERADAQRVLELCRSLEQAGWVGDSPALRVELGRLVEYLGRRSSHAVPLASLGRAVLARLSGSSIDFERGLSACDEQLTLFGL